MGQSPKFEVPNKKVIEMILLLCFITSYFVIDFLDLAYLDTSTHATFLFIVGLILALRCSEYAVEGIKDLVDKAKLSNYVGGVISSLASNTPEIVVAILAALRGFTEFAIIVAVTAAAFNALLLGLVIIVGAIKIGHVDLPEELVRVETPVMRGTIVMLAIVVFVGVLEFLFNENQLGEYVAIPHDVALLLVLTYIAYLFFLFKYKPTLTEEEINAREEEAERVCIKKMILFLIFGFFGIFIAGEMLSQGLELAVHQIGLSEIVLALLVGAAGAIPEHIIALIGTIKSKKEGFELGVGNLLAGVMQSYLLVIGVVGSVVSIFLDEFIVFELSAGAVLIWMLKSSITDDKRLDIYEGTMIIITQIFALTIIIETIL